VNYDDPQTVEKNLQVTTGLSSANAAWAFTTFHSYNWHPLTWLSLQLDAQLFGPGPSGFHLTNVVLHAASTVLLFLALRLMTGAIWRSSLVAYLFALHPLHVESVAWIAERKDVLSGFFWMTTCLAYGWYAAKPGLLRYLVTLVAFALGLLAKPMLVTLPFVLLLLDYWPLGRGTRGRQGEREKDTAGARRLAVFSPLLLEKAPFLALAAGCCAMTVFAQQSAIRSIEEYPWHVRMENALVSYCVYIRQTVWPANLSLFYPHPFDVVTKQGGEGIAVWQVVGAVVALAAVTIVVCVKGRAYPYLPVGWFWYLGTLVPVIGLVQVGPAARADRYTYLPIVGLFIAGVWTAADLAARWRVQRAAVALVAIALLLCTFRCWQQLGYWRDNITLWEHALEAGGDSHIAHMNFAVVCLQKGMYEPAANHFRETLRFDPDNSHALHDLAFALLRQGKVQEALEQYRVCVRRFPKWARAHYSLALVLRELGQTQEAISEYQQASRCDPSWDPTQRKPGS
jgi:Tfp pilus assembly protein PilF